MKPAVGLLIGLALLFGAIFGIAPGIVGVQLESNLESLSTKYQTTVDDGSLAADIPVHFVFKRGWVHSEFQIQMSLPSNKSPNGEVKFSLNYDVKHGPFLFAENAKLGAAHFKLVSWDLGGLDDVFDADAVSQTTLDLIKNFSDSFEFEQDILFDFNGSFHMTSTSPAASLEYAAGEESLAIHWGGWSSSSIYDPILEKFSSSGGMQSLSIEMAQPDKERVVEHRVDLNELYYDLTHFLFDRGGLKSVNSKFNLGNVTASLKKEGVYVRVFGLEELGARSKFQISSDQANLDEAFDLEVGAVYTPALNITDAAFKFRLEDVSFPPLREIQKLSRAQILATESGEKIILQEQIEEQTFLALAGGFGFHIDDLSFSVDGQETKSSFHMEMAPVQYPYENPEIQAKAFKKLKVDGRLKVPVAFIQSIDEFYQVFGIQQRLNGLARQGLVQMDDRYARSAFKVEHGVLSVRSRPLLDLAQLAQRYASQR